MNQREVAIIGGGITGLVLAFLRKKKGDRVRLFESSQRLGGYVRSEPLGSFLLEQGPNTVLLSAELKALIEELGLLDSLIFPDAKATKRYLLSTRHNSRLLAVPRNIRHALLTPLLSVKAKFRLLGEVFVPASHAEDESVRDFFTRRFGKELADIASAAVGGIYGADSARLSLRSAFPELHSIEQRHGSIIRGALFRSKSKQSGPRKSIISFDGGLETFVRTLEKKFTAQELCRSTKVTSIERLTSKHGYRLFGNGPVSNEELGVFDAIYFCTPAEASSEILKSIDLSISEQIRSIPHAPIGLLHLAVRRSATPHPLDGFGFLIPEGTRQKLLGVIFASSIFPGRAPAEDHLLSCFVGGMRQPLFADVRSEGLQREILAEITEILGLEETPRVLSATYYKQAIPNFELGHHRREESFSEFERSFPGIFLLSSWRKGVGVPDRIRTALQAAE